VVGYGALEQNERANILESVCAENNENYQNILGLSEYPMPEAKTSDF